MICRKHNMARTIQAVSSGVKLGSADGRSRDTVGIAATDNISRTMGPGKRLKIAIKAAGYKHISAFAGDVGLPPVTVRQHINRDVVPASMAGVYLRRLVGLKVSADWLLFGKGPGPALPDSIEQPRKEMPRLGPTQASAPARDELEDLASRIDRLLIVAGEITGSGDVRFFDTADTRASLADMASRRGPKAAKSLGLLVATEALRPRYSAGDMLIFNVRRYETNWRREVGRECIVQIHNGPVVLRHVRHGAAQDRPTLVGDAVADIEQAVVKWVVPVVLVRREAAPRGLNLRRTSSTPVDEAIESMTARRPASYLSERDARELTTYRRNTRHH